MTFKRESRAEGIGHQGRNGWEGDPTHSPPPKMRSDGPAPVYALIHSSHYIPRDTPLAPEMPTPRGYIYFREYPCERSFVRLNSRHVE